MNVLSLFDGISCARVALDRANIKVKTYYACEIEKNAIKVSQQNYPDIVRLGDVREIQSIAEPIDLLIGGSPCQDMSISKKDRKGLEGSRSSLFYEYVRIRNLLKPKYFILENVASMPKKDKDIITKEMGVEPVMFDASLVSAQSRKRFFWTNIQFDLPEDKGIKLKDILQPDADVDERFITKNKSFSYSKTNEFPKENEIEHEASKKQRTLVKTGAGIRGIQNEEGKWIQTLSIRKDEKANCLVSSHTTKTALVADETCIRKLTPIECERLQGLPDDYTKPVSMTQRYKCLGNGFNADVVAHILSLIHK